MLPFESMDMLVDNWDMAGVRDAAEPSTGVDTTLVSNGELEHIFALDVTREARVEARLAELHNWLSNSSEDAPFPLNRRAAATANEARDDDAHTSGDESYSGVQSEASYEELDPTRELWVAGNAERTHEGGRIWT